MKPTEQQLKDPQWWDDNVDSGLDYCYTTDKDWEGDPACVNRYEFTDKNGFCGIDAEYKLVVRPKRWMLHCKRPTSKPTETERPEGATHKVNEYYVNSPSLEITERPVEEAKCIPKVGEWCEILFNGGEWGKRFYIGKNSNGHRIYHNLKGDLQNLTDMESRPVKSDRDVFICCTSEAICGASIEQLDVKGNVRRIAGILFDAGFKAPESNDE